MERTFVMVKPDGVDKRLIGEVISRIERKGLKIAGLKMMKLSEEFAGQHYAEHVGKPFYPALIKFTVSGPIVAMVIEGPDVIHVMREMAGKTNPAEAAPGTIRKELAMYVTYNIVHCSDCKESADREINHFFKPEEIINYTTALESWNTLRQWN